MSNIVDAIFAAFLLVVFGVFAIIGLSIFTGISDSGLLGTYAGSFKGFYDALNGVAIFIAIGIALAAVFAGLMVRSHPIFFIIAVIMVFVQFMVVPSFVQVYNQVAQGMSVQVQNDMAQQSQIMQVLPILTALGTMLTIIVGIMRE